MIHDSKKMQRDGIVTLLTFLGVSLYFTTILALFYPFGDVIFKVFTESKIAFVAILILPILLYTFYFIRFLQRLYLDTFPNIKKWILSLFWLLFVIKIDVLLLAIVAYKRSKKSFILLMLLLLNIITTVTLQQLLNPMFHSDLFVVLSITGIILVILSLWSLIPQKTNTKIKIVAIFLIIGSIINLWIVHFQTHLVTVIATSTSRQQQEYGMPKSLAEYNEKFCPIATPKGIEFCNLLKQLDDAQEEMQPIEPIMKKIDAILDSKELLNYPHLTDRQMWDRFLPNNDIRVLTRAYKKRIAEAIKINNKPQALANLNRMEQLLYSEHHNINQVISGLTYFAILNLYLESIEELYQHNLFNQSDLQRLAKTLENLEKQSQNSIEKTFQGESIFGIGLVDAFLEGKVDKEIPAYNSCNRLAIAPVYITLIKDKIFIANHYIKFFEKILTPKKEPFESYQNVDEIFNIYDAKDLPPFTMVTPIAIPNLGGAYTRLWSGIAEIRLTRVAMDGTLSEKLLDPFSGKPFLKANNNIIYSIGKNKKDDQGIYDYKTKKDDIAFKLKVGK